MRKLSLLMVLALAAAPLTTVSASERTLTKRQLMNRVASATGASSSAALSGGGSAPAFGDYDDDGRQDLAVGIPNEDALVNGTGAVQIFYGTSTGVTPGNTLLTEDMVTGGDTAESFDNFGQSLAGGDFNGDGISDLAVGIPGEDVGAIANAGAIAVFMGSPLGITGAGDTQYLTQNDDASGEFAEQGDEFGSALVAGRFDTGPTSDLAVGAPFENLCDTCSTVIEGAGVVNVFYGSAPSGLNPATSHSLSQENTLLNGTPETGDGFGTTLAAGDLGKNGQMDLAIGSNDSVGEMQAAGAVNIVYGINQNVLGSQTNGLFPLGDQMFTQDTPGVPGVAADSDFFGSFGLAIGDMAGTSKRDLIIGIPGETVGGADLGGMVLLLRGSANGVVTSGNRTYSQNSPNVPDTTQLADLFGYRVAAGDVNGDGRADMLVGGPGESFGSGVSTAQLAGAIWYFRGTSTGPTTTGSKWWNQNTAGIADFPQSNDNLGVALSVANYGKSSRADVAFSVPGESLNDGPGVIDGAGAVHLLFGSASGPTTTGARFLNQNCAGCPDPAEAFDGFGSALN